MAQFQDIVAFAQAIDAETNEIATIVADLRAQLAGNPTPDQIDAVALQLQGVSERLAAVAAGGEPVIPGTPDEPTP